MIVIDVGAVGVVVVVYASVDLVVEFERVGGLWFAARHTIYCGPPQKTYCPCCLSSFQEGRCFCRPSEFVCFVTCCLLGFTPSPRLASDRRSALCRISILALGKSCSGELLSYYGVISCLAKGGR